MILNSINEIPERMLQNGVHSLLANPSIIRSCESGKRLQILSPGRINVHAGPDFLEIGVLLEGNVVVGDAEFHRKSSEWEQHSHSSDERYNSVILHIVLENNSISKKQPFEVLLLSKDEVLEELNKVLAEQAPEADVNSIEDLQHFALIRLLRKTADAQKLINDFGLDEAFRQIVTNYIIKYNSRRRRPVYSNDKLKTILSNIDKSHSFKFLKYDINENPSLIPDRMYSLLSLKSSDEGAHLRREIILNCVLPVAICLADEAVRINLFLWYWSTPALNQYGILSRRFSNLPQNFLWQQQGMLEFMLLHGKKPNAVSETIKNYGFAEILSFYKLGRLPLNILEEN